MKSLPFDENPWRISTKTHRGKNWILCCSTLAQAPLNQAAVVGFPHLNLSHFTVSPQGLSLSEPAFLPGRLPGNIKDL
uniref:Uncharacterized protein n=1 Tax=Rhizophora mucronata TaxID=61149 RepID=A0A2P2NHJ4_RHIMU